MQKENEKLNKTIEAIQAEHPNWKLFQIVVNSQDADIFIARKCNWAEYKQIIGKVKDEATANEVLVQKFLVYPKVNYETLNLEWEPGLIVTLAQQIQKGLGFSGDGAQIKNL